MPVPPGFQIRSDKGTFEDINSGFGVVAERVNYTETADKLAQSLYDNLVQSTVFKGGVLTGSSDDGDRARRDFIGLFGTKPLEGPIEGTIFARTFGQTACAVTVITYEGAVAPHAQTVAAAIAGLTVATTATAPTPTTPASPPVSASATIPPRSTPAPSAAAGYTGARWHGIPTPGTFTIFSETAHVYDILVAGTFAEVEALYLEALQRDGYVRTDKLSQPGIVVYSFRKDTLAITVGFAASAGRPTILVEIDDAP